MNRKSGFPLEVLEEAMEITVDEIIAEYMEGQYGDPADWSKQSIVDAELDGYSGDMLRRKFAGEDHRHAVRDWSAALMLAYEKHEEEAK